MAIPFQASGLWTALVTPFESDGSIDREVYHKHLDFQMNQGVTGVVPCGTTGESPSLTWHEHDEIIATALERVGGRIGVMAGTGSNATAEAIRGTEDARKNGASAALIVDCYYNGPSTLELRKHYYEAILEAVADIPIVPYIIPGRTGCALSAEDLAILHQSAPARVPAVKEATGDLDRMRRDRELGGDSLAILSGDDDMTLAMMSDPNIRASGVISVMSNLVPATLAKMVAAQAAGDVGRAVELADQVTPLLRLVGCVARDVRILPDGRRIEVADKFRNPVPLKTMMAGLGMVNGFCRRPLGRMTAPAVGLCRDALRQVWQNAPETLRPIGEFYEIDVASRIDDDAVWSALTA